MVEPLASLRKMAEEPDRLQRAREEDMNIHKTGPDQYEVVSENATSYDIDLATMECTCDDYRTRDIDKCKHLYKGLLISGDLDE